MNFSMFDDADQNFNRKVKRKPSPSRSVETQQRDVKRDKTRKPDYTLARQQKRGALE